MRRGVALAISLVGLVVGASGCSDNGTENPANKACGAESECDDGNPCTFDFCSDGHCSYAPADDGAQPGASQTPGDCKLIACQDALSAVIDFDDPPLDDGFDCLIPNCANGEAGEELAATGYGCLVEGDKPGACDAAGVCNSCAPAEPTVRQYVDPLNGSDDAEHGAGPGNCAYKTLTYALTQAAYEIELAVGTYNASSGEAFPIELIGTQRLICSSDGDQTARIVGTGSYGIDESTTIVIRGAANAIADCTVAGVGAPGACITVNSQGPLTNHLIERCNVSLCRFGISVWPAGDRVAIHDSIVHDNTEIGIHWSGADKTGELLSNALSANGANDIFCSTASPLLTGSGNATPSCSGCQNCPF